MSVPERLPAGLARRITLAAQGFADPRPTAEVGTRQLRRLVERLAVVQIDSVNVLSRSHYLPAFSRLGDYPRAALDDLTARRHAVFEYWAHEASFLPVRLQPHLRWRMAAAQQHAWGTMVQLQRERPGFVAEVLERVRAEGPLKAADLLEGRRERSGEMWDWHAGKVALEWLFFSGEVTATHRTTSFEKVYDLTERVLPAAVLRTPTPEPADAIRELVRTAARALGVATERDLRDYFRLKPMAARTAIGELADAGELLPVEVAGWGAPGWLDPEARRPRWIRARALLSPFDSLVWERPRVERIFGFRYRLEIYTPAAKRVHGYYVLPFLL
ncbi:MAG TPA: crosslink repair DNA glycosylase YcaQ family protein, partial [Blastococcus sp.]